MPELPEVETTKASLAPLIGKTVHSVHRYQPKLREMMPEDLDSLAGFKLDQVHRRAKYLLIDFIHTDGRKKSLLVHLGMSGSLQQHPAQNPPHPRKHDHLILVFTDGSDHVALHYHDPRRFGMVLWAHNDDYIQSPQSLGEEYSLAQRFLAHLGIEPLDDRFDGQYLYDLIHKIGQPITKPLSGPIKGLIMDQKVVVGVGNIYATESLFLANIHPATPAYQLSLDQLKALAEHIKHILQQSITQGGTTLKDFTSGSGKTGYFQQTLLVYGRHQSPCNVCQNPLQSIKIAGRTSVYCPHCQPHPINKPSTTTPHR